MIAISLTATVGQVVVDTFSNRLDRDLIGASGPHPTPTGLLSVAAQVTGADWLAAAVAGKAAIGQAGGQGVPLLRQPDRPRPDRGQPSDETGRQLYPDASQTSFAGLATVESVGASHSRCVIDRLTAAGW